MKYEHGWTKISWRHIRRPTVSATASRGSRSMGYCFGERFASKYNYDENEPLKSDFTWDRMEAIAKDIVNKESKVEEGYAWQGNHYEGLTAMLWNG